MRHGGVASGTNSRVSRIARGLLPLLTTCASWFLLIIEGDSSILHTSIYIVMDPLLDNRRAPRSAIAIHTGPTPWRYKTPASTTTVEVPPVVDVMVQIVEQFTDEVCFGGRKASSGLR